jgi:hypothetical protein
MLQFWHDIKHECNDCVHRDELNALVPVGLTISTLTMAPISTADEERPDLSTAEREIQRHWRDEITGEYQLPE